nr:5-formyltetrahydrofolate cyclo-ligase [Bacteroides sp.]
MKKDEIRRAIRACKTLLNDNDRALGASTVFDMLERTGAFVMAEHVLLYHSLPDELSTRRFLDKWAGRKSFYLPRVNGVNLDILPYDRSTLRYGAFHIEEPQGADVTPLDVIDMVIVPGVAFDRQGNRVGRGKGYYDRLLRECRATKVGVGYDFQLVEEGIDAEEHDVTMDIVITQSNYIIVKKKR